MRTSKKTLSIALLLLLVPTAVIAWLGLSEFTRLEEQVRNEMTSALQDELRATERELEARVRTRVGALADDLSGRSLDEIVREVAQPDVADGYSTAGTLLFRNTLQGIWPLRSTRARNVTARLAPTTSRARYRDLSRRLAECEFLVARGMLEDACEHLLDWKNPYSARDAVARLELERGRMLFARERFDDAQKYLERASRAMQSLKPSMRRRAGNTAIDLITRYYTVRVAAKKLATREGASQQAEQAIELQTLELLDAIAHGEFDPESDEWLDRMFSRVEQLLPAPRLRSQKTTDDVESIIKHRSWHVATRKLQQAVIDRDIARLETSKSDLVLYTIHEAEASTLVAFTPIEVMAARQRQRAWIGKVVNLERVVAPIARDVEDRLAEKERSYSLVVVDANGRSIAPQGSELAPRSAEMRDATTRRALGGALLGLTLELRPDDLEGVRRATRRGILVKSLLLLGLALLAGVGAFLLLRTVRRESELSDLRTSFVGRVSHELKTPLALIRMYAETLAMGRVRDREKTIEFAQVITKESGRLTDMIDRVLDFSKIEAGSRTYVRTHTDIADLVRETVEEYRPHLEDSGCEVHVECDDALYANVEAEALQQALVNLLSNARKYSEEDKRIDVTLEASGEDAILRVTDRGIGVAEDEREKIFETFYRSTSAGERRGAGLGLALVRHFVEAHGGTCRATDNPDPEESGTTIELRLPLAHERTDQEPS